MNLKEMLASSGWSQSDALSKWPKDPSTGLPEISGGLGDDGGDKESQGAEKA